MLKECQWYPILMILLHDPVLFRPDQLEQIMDVAAWYYENDYSPLEAAKCIAGGKMVIDAVRLGIKAQKEAIEGFTAEHHQ